MGYETVTEGGGMKDIVVYRLDNGKWAIAINPQTDCRIWTVSSKKRALEKAKELEIEL